MARLAFLLVLSLTILLDACALNGQTETLTPTPFPTAAQFQRITTAAPIPIALNNLAANPDFFLGATLQLAGQFQPLPRLECEGEAYRSPASWALVSDGFLANASGMDEQLRSLLSKGQPITVEGRWLKYEGPVGCGNAAIDQDIWYLSIDRVLDPHPLVRASATPHVGAPVPAEATQLLPDTATPAGEIAVSETPTAAINETPIPSPPPAQPASTLPAYPGATPVPTSESVSPTATLSTAATPTQPGSTASPSATEVGTPQTPTPTVSTTTQATPSGSVVDQGSMEPEDLKMGSLAAGTTDRWTMELVAGDTIRITVAPGASVDIVLSVLDSNGTTLVNDQNLAPAGEVETVTALDISAPGIYSVLVRTAQGEQADYALMFMTADSYNFVFKGTLTSNVTRSDSLPADTDHFWFFSAGSGESISLDVLPVGGGDPYLELYDPDGTRMLTIDDTGDGELEYLDSYTLLAAGLYGLRVAEFDFQAMSYQVTVSKP